MNSYYKPRVPDDNKCPHNDGVICYPNQKDCSKCGWNPDVAKVRKLRICEKLGIKLPDCLRDTNKR
ncbi:MAG: hypothetical protein ACI4PO_03860 [Faecousia sp.]